MTRAPRPSDPLPPEVLLTENLADLARVVGDTPLALIEARVGPRRVLVAAKLEHFNLTGSIKDRMVLGILAEAARDGSLRPGVAIAEASSGNTGISCAAIGRALGHPVRIWMPDWMSRERRDLIVSLGAELVPVSRDQGGFQGSIALADAWAREHGAFRPRQFDAAANVRAHERTTGPEIAAQLAWLGLEPQAFVAGVGTGGTVMGVGRALRRLHPGCRIHPLEPADSPTLRTGRKEGSHRIQGVGDEFVPSIVVLEELEGLVDVRDGDAIVAAQRLARELGIAVGISSGANFLGAVAVGLELGDGAVVATVFADSNKKYLSTDLCREEPRRAGDLAPRIELGRVRTAPRTRSSV